MSGLSIFIYFQIFCNPLIVGGSTIEDSTKIFKFDKETGDWKFIGTTFLKRSFFPTSFKKKFNFMLMTVANEKS